MTDAHRRKPAILIILALVVAPALVVCLAALVTLVLSIGPIFPDPHISASNWWPRIFGGFIGLFLPILAGLIWMTRKVERWAFGAGVSAPDGFRPKHTRIAASAIVAVVLVSITSGALGFAWNTYDAFYGDSTEQWDALTGLSTSHSAPACYVLEQLANRNKPTAIARLEYCPSAKPLLMKLAANESGEVRASAGWALSSSGGDDDAWARVRQLWQRDSDVNVRREVSLGVVRHLESLHEARRAEAIAFFERAQEPDVRLRVQIATALTEHHVGGRALYDDMWSVINDPHQNTETRVAAMRAVALLKEPQSAAALWDIERAAYDEGFASQETERQLREGATAALGLLLPYQRPKEYPSAFRNEGVTRAELQQLSEAQAKYHDRFGLYAPHLDCLVTPSACVAGADIQAPFLKSIELTLAVRNGYTRSLVSNGTHYRIVATPERLGETGAFVYCADDTTGICVARSAQSRVALASAILQCPQPEEPPRSSGQPSECGAAVGR